MNCEWCKLTILPNEYTTHGGHTSLHVCIERLRAEVETARRDAVALDHAYAGAMAEVEALQSCACSDCNREILTLRAENEALRKQHASLWNAKAPPVEGIPDPAEIDRLRAENEALRYLLNGIASPASIEAAIKYTQVAIAPQRGDE